jgi:hypothetical protein
MKVTEGVNNVGTRVKRRRIDGRTGGDEHPPLVGLYSLLYDPVHNVGNRRSCVCTSVSPTLTVIGCCKPGSRLQLTRSDAYYLTGGSISVW